MNEKIKLEINIDQTGANSALKETRKLEKSYTDITKELKNMSVASSGLGNIARSNVKKLRLELEQAELKARNAGRTIKSINLEINKAGAVKGKLKTGSILGTTDTKEFQQNVKKFEALQRASFAREAQLIKQEKARIRSILLQEDKRTAALQLANAKKLQKEKEINSKNFSQALRSGLATFGFAGLNVVQQLSTIFDSLNFSGIAGNISSIAGMIGSLFGQMFEKVFSELGNAVGRSLETVLNVIAKVLQTGMKAISGFLTGMFISSITLAFAPAINFIIGLFAGFSSALIQIFTGMVDIISEIVKGLIDVLSSIIKAGLAILKGIFDTFKDIVINIWKGLWEGLVSITKKTMEIIVGLISEGIDQLSLGFKDLVESQRTAAKGFFQIASTVEKLNRPFIENIKNVDKLQDSLRIDFGIEQAQVASAVYFALSSNFRSVAEASNLLRSSAELATVANVDFNQVARTSAGIINAYGMSAKDADRVTRALWGGVALGSFELDELLQSLGNVISSSAALKIPIEDLIGSIAALSNQSINAFKGTVGLNRIFETIISPGSAAAKTFEALGIRVNEFRKGLIDLPTFLEDVAKKLPEEELRDIFATAQGRRAFLGLSNNAENFRRILTQSANEGKKLSENFANTKNLFSFMINQVGQVFSVLRKNIVGSLIEPFRPVFKEFSEWFKNFANSVGQLDFIGFGKELADSFLRIFNTIKQLPKFFNEIFNVSINVENIFETIKQYVRSAVDYLADPKTYQSIVQSFLIVIETVKSIGKLIKEMFNDPNLMTANINTFEKIFMDSFMAIGSFILDVLQKVFTIAIDFFVETLGARLKVVVQDLLESIIGGLTGAFNTMSREILIKVREINNPVAADIVRRVGDAFGSIGNFLGQQNNALRLDKNSERYINKRETVGTVGELIGGLSDENTDKIIEALGSLNLGGALGKDLSTIFVNMLKESKNYEELSRKFLSSLDFGMKGVLGNRKEDPEQILGILFSKITDPGFFEGLGGVSDKSEFKKIERELNVNAIRLQGSKDFIKNSKNLIPDLKKSFDETINKLKNISTSAWSGQGGLKENNSSIINQYVAALQEIQNKVIFATENSTLAQKENTAAIRENISYNKNNKTGTSNFMSKVLYKMVSPINLASEFSRLQALNPQAQISSVGGARTGGGYMHVLKVEIPKIMNDIRNAESETNTEKAKREESTINETKTINEKITQQTEVIKELLNVSKSIDSKTVDISKVAANNYTRFEYPINKNMPDVAVQN